MTRKQVEFPFTLNYGKFFSQEQKGKFEFGIISTANHRGETEVACFGKRGVEWLSFNDSYCEIVAPQNVLKPSSRLVLHMNQLKENISKIFQKVTF